MNKLFDTIESLAFIALYSTLFIIASDFIAFVLAGASI